VYCIGKNGDVRLRTRATGEDVGSFARAPGPFHSGFILSPFR
jgi:hypothetical protein